MHSSSCNDEPVTYRCTFKDCNGRYETKEKFIDHTLFKHKMIIDHLDIDCYVGEMDSRNREEEVNK